MISPRVTSFSRLELRENAPGYLEGGVRRGPSGVEGEVGDRLDELLLRDAVLQCALEVERQFIRAVACDEGGDRDQTAVARRQAGPPPDVAEEHDVGVLRESWSDVAERCACGGRFLRHIGLGHGRLL